MWAVAGVDQHRLDAESFSCCSSQPLGTQCPVPGRQHEYRPRQWIGDPLLIDGSREEEPDGTERPAEGREIAIVEEKVGAGDRVGQQIRTR